jgi:predicted NBD/HSP70 family sugar kinase
MTTLRPRGSHQGGLRQYNERVVLQAIRMHGALPGAEIARLTQLTAQTVSLISKRLTDDGLLLRGEPVRGKVGQPSIPLRLNPDGAYAIGIKVGRRSLDTLLVDFTAQKRHRWTLDFPYADPDQILAEIGQRLKDIRRKLGPDGRTRVQGIGIAAPLSMGGWQQLLGLPPKVAEQWQHIHLEHEVAKLSDHPVMLVKDTAAACVAELVAGRGRSVKSFLYVFVDTFIGGGLVLDSELRAGRHGNAGAIGSIPLIVDAPSRHGAGSVRSKAAANGHAAPRTTEQLLGIASLLNLERAFEAAGLDMTAVTDPRALEAPWREHTMAWVDTSARAIAHVIECAACLLDLDGVIIDGSFDRTLLRTLLDTVDAAMNQDPWEGVARPALLAGTIGSDARALGGALLPLYAGFSPDRDLFLKALPELAA